MFDRVYSFNPTDDRLKSLMPSSPYWQTILGILDEEPRRGEKEVENRSFENFG